MNDTKKILLKKIIFTFIYFLFGIILIMPYLSLFSLLGIDFRYSEYLYYLLLSFVLSYSLLDFRNFIIPIIVVLLNLFAFTITFFPIYIEIYKPVIMYDYYKPNYHYLFFRMVEENYLDQIIIALIGVLIAFLVRFRIQNIYKKNSTLENYK